MAWPESAMWPREAGKGRGRGAASTRCGQLQHALPEVAARLGWHFRQTISNPKVLMEKLGPWNALGLARQLLRLLRGDGFCLGLGHDLAAQTAVRREHSAVAREMPAWGAEPAPQGEQ